MNFLSKLWRVIWDDVDYTLWKPSQAHSDRAERLEEVKRYTQFEDIPEHLRAELFPSVWSNVMKQRLGQGITALFVLERDNKVAGYCWVQDARFFRLKFGWMGNFHMIGPGGTHPDFRRQGIFDLMLDQVVYEVKGKPSMAFVEYTNKASRGGVTKKGWDYQGRYRIVVFLKVFRVIVKRVD